MGLRASGLTSPWAHATLPTRRSGSSTILATTRMSASQEHIPLLDCIGLQIDERRDGYAVAGREIGPHHLYRAGVVHGSDIGCSNGGVAVARGSFMLLDGAPGETVGK